MRVLKIVWDIGKSVWDNLIAHIIGGNLFIQGVLQLQNTLKKKEKEKKEKRLTIDPIVLDRHLMQCLLVTTNVKSMLVIYGKLRIPQSSYSLGALSGRQCDQALHYKVPRNNSTTTISIIQEAKLYSYATSHTIPGSWYCRTELLVE